MEKSIRNKFNENEDHEFIEEIIIVIMRSVRNENIDAIQRTEVVDKRRCKN